MPEATAFEQEDDANRQKDWSEYLSSGPAASGDFMADVDDLPLQERDFFFDKDPPSRHEHEPNVK